MNFLHYFKSSVTLKCWIKGTACKGWIMPTMTSSTGITLSACSALSRKQTFFYCSILFPFYFLHHRHYFPFRPMTLSKGKCSKTKKSSRDHKASSSYISQLVFFLGGEWGSEFIFCFQLPPFLFLFQTVARSTLPNRRHSFTPVGWGIMAGKEKKKKNRNLQDGDTLTEKGAHNHTMQTNFSFSFVFTFSFRTRKGKISR